VQEYTFRVRLREAREKVMDEQELKKQGPLGLRLIDGLQGTALAISRQISLDKLAGADGPTLLLKHLTESLRPRRVQEARELYAAGAQSGGVLARQFTEPMSSFILRRRTWYQMLTDLDSELRLPEAILAEQVLSTCGLTEDQKIMVRTTIGGDMKVSKVCDELIAQHSRIHEGEVGRRQDRSGKGYGKQKGKKSWNNNSSSFMADYEHEHGLDDQWHSHSQSLGGYEEVDTHAYYGNEDPYEAENTLTNEDEVICECFASMVFEGLDEADQESAEMSYKLRRKLSMSRIVLTTLDIRVSQEALRPGMFK